MAVFDTYNEASDEHDIHIYKMISHLGHDNQNDEWIRKSAQIEGWLFKGEHEFLRELATRSSDGHILEIGSWMGKSTCILAGACIEKAPHTRVICIDTFDMRGTPEQEKYHKRLVTETSGTFYQFIENAKQLGFIDWILPIATTSEKALPIIPWQFRMIFIDGTHNYENVKKDVELSLPKLIPGGLLALHDAINSPWVDVANYVKNHIQNCPNLRFYGCRSTIVAFEKVAERK